MTFTFTASVEIEAESEQSARTLFDDWRESTIPSDWGVTIFDLRAGHALLDRATEYVARYADLNEEPEGGDCRKLLAEIAAR